MAVDCSTFSCMRRPPSQKRKSVWTIDGKPYCNICFLNWMDTHEVGRQRIVRLFDEENLYEDIRPQKRRKRSILDQSVAA
jgi:hypothetical protein